MTEDTKKSVLPFESEEDISQEELDSLGQAQLATLLVPDALKEHWPEIKALYADFGGELVSYIAGKALEIYSKEHLDLGYHLFVSCERPDLMLVFPANYAVTRKIDHQKGYEVFITFERGEEEIAELNEDREWMVPVYESADCRDGLSPIKDLFPFVREEFFVDGGEVATSFVEYVRKALKSLTDKEDMHQLSALLSQDAEHWGGVHFDTKRIVSPKMFVDAILDLASFYKDPENAGKKYDLASTEKASWVPSLLGIDARMAFVAFLEKEPPFVEQVTLQVTESDLEAPTVGEEEQSQALPLSEEENATHAAQDALEGMSEGDSLTEEALELVKAEVSQEAEGTVVTKQASSDDTATTDLVATEMSLEATKQEETTSEPEQSPDTSSDTE